MTDLTDLEAKAKADLDLDKLLKRRDQEFTGEAHLTSAELTALIARVRAPTTDARERA